MGGFAVAVRAEQALRSARRSRAGWALLAVVLAVALMAGIRFSGGPPTTAQRVEQIAADVRCPSCEGLSVLESDAATAVAVRDAIHRLVVAGRSDPEIERYLISRYGPSILLRPSGSGFSALVWVLPPVGAAVVIGSVGALFWRRRWRRSAEPDGADLELVARARQSGGGL